SWLRVALFELELLLAALARGGNVGDRVAARRMLRLEFVPGRNTTRLECAHEIGERGPDHMVGEARIPGDVYAEREVLLGREVARQLALHEREHALHGGARLPDLVGRMRRLELHPVGVRLVLIC